MPTISLAFYVRSIGKFLTTARRAQNSAKAVEIPLKKFSIRIVTRVGTSIE